MPSFKDKVVIITGGSSGIGADTAVYFARASASVVLLARSVEGLHKTAQRCVEAGSTEEKVLYLPTDVTVEAEVKEAVQKAKEKFGKIDVLVNNAGMTKYGGLADTTVADLEEMFSVNVKSAYMMTQACLPHLLQSRGNIVNLSSIAGTRPAYHVLTYAMAKAAVEQLTKCTALELAPQGVRVNAVCPGVVETDIFTKPGSFVKDPKDLSEFFKQSAQVHPLGRIGQTQDVAAAIMFLASDEASFTTGCCFPVDGGRCETMTNIPKM